MSDAVKNLQDAQKYAMSIRPKVGGFPYLAEVLRQAGVFKNIWQLPSCQSLYLTKLGPVIMIGAPLVSGATDVAKFNESVLIEAIRTDQAGKSTFPEFLLSAWKAGVVSYEADFEKRHVVYHGAAGESYLENYPAVSLEKLI